LPRRVQAGTSFGVGGAVCDDADRSTVGALSTKAMAPPSTQHAIHSWLHDLWCHDMQEITSESS